ncbi:MAG: PEP-CTERM sorting domain-containing protein [Microcystis novacekii Mn_MB_F_20050700_S1]|uniref:PEP-CTERM sorting domain-containing protein n=1 Tax=Microcystis novacekii Mn_MB_F_20050700_S1D TaxID=2486266 RepID=A0A552ICH0_9CHRO|nr:MAG: PEP-CTERM sorting domain-containing protein [Microcystis novacekii Mn_MB_F_20050700_S1]TRU81147.1 MAG: PEP-CTERM sorting domain-containing protein [Microcystis novacekii Mn_MB_F_20050700_S1D]
MIKDFSKRAATVAIATAGSVAAFGFSGVAPAQAALVTCPTFQVLSAFLALGPEGCQDMDKVYVPVSATVNGSSSGVDYNNFVSGMITISHSEGVLGTGDVHRISYTRGVALPSALGTEFALQYKIKILPGSSAMFANVSLGVDIPGETKGFASSKLITGAGGFSHTLSIPGPGGGTAGPIAVPPDLTELTVLDKITVTQAPGPGIQPPQFSAFTNTFTQTPQNISVPEPSAILGILAVAGAGAFARRKS